MAFPVRVCAFVGRFADTRVSESVALLLPHLAGRGVEVLVSEDLPAAAATGPFTRVDERTIAARADLVIAIGGDGTLLYAARMVARQSRHDPDQVYPTHEQRPPVVARAD